MYGIKTKRIIAYEQIVCLHFFFLLLTVSQLLEGKC